MENRVRQTLADLFDAQTAEKSVLHNLGGHASLRIYWRIELPTEVTSSPSYPREESTLMAMVLPEGANPLQSAEGESSDSPMPQELPFIDVQRYLMNLGMPVPTIDRVDMTRGVLILEDLGDELFEDAVLAANDDKGIDAVYREAIDLLIEFQSALRAAEKQDSIAFERRFDAELLRWELDHYTEWGLQAQLGEDVVADVADEIDPIFDRLVSELLELEQTLVLRDYQSRNIMNKNDAWILIDFQDALIGPFIYDLVALLRDSYIDLPTDMLRPLIDYYVARGAEAGLPWCEESDHVHRAFHLQTIQRKLKDAGRFINIDRVKNNPAFLDYYGPSIQYVRHALEQLDDFDDLHELLTDIEPQFST